MINRNKQGLRLDLKKPEGVEVFMRLAREADVIIESFRPGVMDKLGVGYAVIAAVNPKIAYCSISGYGQDGPYKDLAGHDINYLGYAGVLDQIGSAAEDIRFARLLSAFRSVSETETSPWACEWRRRLGVGD